MASLRTTDYSGGKGTAPVLTAPELILQVPKLPKAIFAALEQLICDYEAKKKSLEDEGDFMWDFMGILFTATLGKDQASEHALLYFDAFFKQLDNAAALAQAYKEMMIVLLAYRCGGSIAQWSKIVAAQERTPLCATARRLLRSNILTSKRKLRIKVAT